MRQVCRVALRRPVAAGLHPGTRARGRGPCGRRQSGRRGAPSLQGALGWKLPCGASCSWRGRERDPCVTHTPYVRNSILARARSIDIYRARARSRRRRGSAPVHASSPRRHARPRRQPPCMCLGPSSFFFIFKKKN
jgi:hypothetical protein